MKIIEIEAQQLRNMENHEGLVIQGCGGELREYFPPQARLIFFAFF